MSDLLPVHNDKTLSSNYFPVKILANVEKKWSNVPQFPPLICRKTGINSFKKTYLQIFVEMLI